MSVGIRVAALALLGLVGTALPASGSELETGQNLHMHDVYLGRGLLDISVQGSSSFDLSAFGSSGQVPGGNCYLQGYPGSRADSTVAGPLTVNAYPGDTTTIYFSRGPDAYFSNYNYSGSVALVKVNQNESYGLGSVVFSPQSVGQTVNVFSGLISGSNPISVPTCLVNITFTAIARPSTSPSPVSTPAPNPATNTCSGPVPCYCQNGYCFNNGATLTPTCTPPVGQTCTPTTTNPSAIGVQYAFGFGSSVSVCKCTATNGK